MNELIQRIWKKNKILYKQMILGALGGLFGALALVAFVVVYSNLAVESLGTVSRESGNRAEAVADRSDKYAKTPIFNRGGVFSDK